MQDPEFQLFTARRFLQLRAGPWSDAVVTGLIDAKQTALMPAALRTLNKCGTEGHRNIYNFS